MVSSQSLMRWLSSVSWTNFWEVAMKSSWRGPQGLPSCGQGPEASSPDSLPLTQAYHIPSNQLLIAQGLWHGLCL